MKMIVGFWYDVFQTKIRRRVITVFRGLMSALIEPSAQRKFRLSLYYESNGLTCKMEVTCPFF